MAKAIQPADNGGLELPDYRWEKILRAVMRGEKVSYSDSVKWLLERHPEYNRDEVHTIMKCAIAMKAYDARRAAAPPGTVWR